MTPNNNQIITFILHNYILILYNVEIYMPDINNKLKSIGNMYTLLDVIYPYRCFFL